MLGGITRFLCPTAVVIASTGFLATACEIKPAISSSADTANGGQSGQGARDNSWVVEGLPDPDYADDPDGGDYVDPGSDGNGGPLPQPPAMGVGPDGVTQLYPDKAGGSQFYLNMDDPYQDGGGPGTTNPN